MIDEVDKATLIMSLIEMSWFTIDESAENFLHISPYCSLPCMRYLLELLTFRRRLRLRQTRQ